MFLSSEVVMSLPLEDRIETIRGIIEPEVPPSMGTGSSLIVV
jgi:hypothetical protein